MAERVAREIWLEAEAADVWEAVVAGAWMADEAHLELYPGGDAWFRCGEEVRSGWVEEASAPVSDAREGRLAFWWALGDEGASRVEITPGILSHPPSLWLLMTVPSMSNEPEPNVWKSDKS